MGSGIRALFEPTHQYAHQGQLFVQLFRSVPVVSVLGHQALVVEQHVAAPPHGLPGGGVKPFEAKTKFPGQESLAAIDQLPGHDKVGLVECFVHVVKNLRDGVQSLHLVERVFETGLCVIKGAQLRYALRRQCFKKMGQGLGGL